MARRSTGTTRRATGGSAADKLEAYETHPDSREQPGVPKGTVKQMPTWESKIFSRHQARLVGLRPGAIQAGDARRPSWSSRTAPGTKDFVPTVFDNLIAKGDMPVTVGIFIHPGTFSDGRANRSFEYDTLSDQYARFLLEEILPEVEKTVKLRHDAASRAIAGSSSGGICALTVAWERPDEFSKVLSWVGSFTNIASGKTVARAATTTRRWSARRAEKADPRVPPGRRQRPGQRQRQLAARQPDDGQVAGVRAATTTISSSARASTATGTAARSCPIRCAGSGAGTGPEVLSY